MLPAGLLLVGLCLLGVQSTEEEIIYTDYEEEVTDAPDYVFDLGDWLFDLLDDTNVCDPNPCFHGAACVVRSDTKFKCQCPDPYVGKRCQKVRNVCQNVRCGAGHCVVNLKKPPFYQCKCRPPFQGPNCRKLPSSPCEPNPCQNGGTCVRKRRRFGCQCPAGFTGRFCQTASSDCYQGNGESYRGSVSVTEEGRECLDWNSFFILREGPDPFEVYSDFPGLEYNNHCRNPDQDDKPWCYFKNKSNGTRLDWDYCKINQCSQAVLPPPPPPPPPVDPAPEPAMFSRCGRIGNITEPTKTNRIFGGTKCFPGAHPWQVSVQARLKGSSSPYSHICGGTLLSSCWVLTAAHCISNSKEYQVVLGGVNLDKDEVMDQTIPVLETIAHENYRELPYALYNDIALLKLKPTAGELCATESSHVRTACLPEQIFPPGKECVVSGWGATETQRYSSQLLNARVFVISEGKCRLPNIYGSVIDNSMYCAGILKGGTDSCQGDSGGPLVCEQNGTHYVSGVVSWGDGCGKENKPGVYANVHTFVSWIKSKMNSS